MSELKVNKISPRSGTDVTLGDSGDTFTLGSGANIAGLTLSDNILFDTASKGIYLGVTSATASNLLDDYEEGTWTPSFTGTTGSPSGVNFTVRVGHYTKIGNQVTVHMYLNISSWSSGPSGDVRIDTLPFTASSSSNLYSSVAIGLASNFARAPVAGYVINNSTEISLRIANSTSAQDNYSGALKSTDVNGNEEIMLTATYQTN